MPAQNVTPVFFDANGNIPNNPSLPALLYQQVFPEDDSLEYSFKNAFRKNNWAGIWADGVYAYHHYHSTAHEVLGVIAGSATLVLGGPGGEETEVRAGDMVVLPAGTGHCRQRASAGFKVVGAYPRGQESYDLCTEEDDAEEKKQHIRQVPLPAADPVGGADGPLLRHWLPGT